MPGAYTHITAANFAAERRTLESLTGFPPVAVGILNTRLRFVELGSVSPDLPYLEIGVPDAQAWADTMHHTRPSAVPRQVLRRLRGMTGEGRDKVFAWILGYLSHVAMDVTLHPVINEKVGPFLENKARHRHCEMTQDVHVYRRLKTGPLDLAEHLDNGIKKCGSLAAGLDPDVRAAWHEALAQNYPDLVAERSLAIDNWFRAFGAAVDAADKSWLFPIARHVGLAEGIVYPREHELDQQYLQALPTPKGPMDFDPLFDAAMRNVLHCWSLAAAAVFENSDGALNQFGDWSLDDGTDRNGRLVFWA